MLKNAPRFVFRRNFFDFVEFRRQIYIRIKAKNLQNRLLEKNDNLWVIFIKAVFRSKRTISRFATKTGPKKSIKKSSQFFIKNSIFEKLVFWHLKSSAFWSKRTLKFHFFEISEMCLKAHLDVLSEVSFLKFFSFSQKK